MSSIWTKSTIVAVSAALISLTVVPALAQPNETQGPPVETQAPPSELENAMPGSERVSKPKYKRGTPQEYQLPQRALAKKCRSGAGTRAEAEKDCAAQLNCPPGTAVNCQYRQNNQDWICSCK